MVENFFFPDRNPFFSTNSFSSALQAVAGWRVEVSAKGSSGIALDDTMLDSLVLLPVLVLGLLKHSQLSLALRQTNFAQFE